MNAMGTLIIFEGPDGVGKTTLAKALHEHYSFQGVKCKYMAFPGNEIGTLGYLVYDIHHHADKYGVENIPTESLQLLHIAAHIDSIENRIIPALRESFLVILDRFWWSTWVYGVIGGADPKIIEAMVDIEKRVWAETHPSCVFLIDRENSFRKDEFSDHWVRLRSAYDELSLSEGKDILVKKVVNDKSIQSSLDEVINIIEDLNFSLMGGR
jgi:dTMP kinase